MHILVQPQKKNQTLPPPRAPACPLPILLLLQQYIPYRGPHVPAAPQLRALEHIALCPLVAWAGHRLGCAALLLAAGDSVEELALELFCYAVVGGGVGGGCCRRGNFFNGDVEVRYGVLAWCYTIRATGDR